jgi:hypothetical protein
MADLDISSSPNEISVRAEVHHVRLLCFVLDFLLLILNTHNLSQHMLWLMFPFGFN